MRQRLGPRDAHPRDPCPSPRLAPPRAHARRRTARAPRRPRRARRDRSRERRPAWPPATGDPRAPPRARSSLGWSASRRRAAGSPEGASRARPAPRPAPLPPTERSRRALPATTSSPTAPGRWRPAAGRAACAPRCPPRPRPDRGWRLRRSAPATARAAGSPAPSRAGSLSVHVASARTTTSNARGSCLAAPSMGAPTQARARGALEQRERLGGSRGRGALQPSQPLVRVRRAKKA